MRQTTAIKISAFLLSASLLTLVAQGAPAGKGVADQVNSVLAATPAPELAPKSRELVSQAKRNEQDSVAIAAVQYVAGARPSSLTFVIEAVVGVRPENAPAIAEAAVKALPSERAAIEEAATKAAPAFAAKITQSIEKALGNSGNQLGQDPGHRLATTPGTIRGNRPSVPPGLVRDPKPGRDPQRDYARP